MRLRFIVSCLALVCAPLPATASNVTVTLGGSATKQTDDNPRSGDASAAVSGSIDLGEKWSLDLAASLTHNRKTPASDATVFPDKGSNNIGSFSLGTTWMPNDNWMAYLTGNFSPETTSFTQSVVSLEGAKGATVDYDAQLKSSSGSGGFRLGASYDTDGESNWEHSIGFDVGLNHLSTDQSIEQLVDRKGNVVEPSSIQTCPAGVKGAACKKVKNLGKAQKTTLNQFTLNAMYIATLFEATDVTVGGTYYLYDKDPNELGYFSLATAGRGGKPAGEVSFGSGVPIAPYLFGANVAVAHNFGEERRLRLTLSGGYNAYDGVDGGNYNGSLKAQWKFNKHWKGTVTLAASRDVDADGNIIPTGSLYLGARYTF